MKSNRRSFMKSVAAAGIAAGPQSGSARAAQSQYVAPVIGGPVATPAALGWKSGLKIRSIETFVQGTNLSIVRIRTDDGSEGYGQTAPFDADISAQDG